MVAQFVFTIEGKTLESLSVTPGPFLVDAAFQRLYSEAILNVQDMKKPDIENMLSGLRQDVNKRYGKSVIKEVLIERMNFLPIDSVRSGSYATETIGKGKAPAK